MVNGHMAGHVVHPVMVVTIMVKGPVMASAGVKLLLPEQLEREKVQELAGEILVDEEKLHIPGPKAAAIRALV